MTTKIDEPDDNNVGYGGATYEEEVEGEKYWASLTPEQQKEIQESYLRRVNRPLAEGFFIEEDN